MSTWHRIAAFGLEVRAAWPLPGSSLPNGRSAPVQADTSVRLLDGKAVDAAWALPGERIFEPTYPDGVTRFTIDRTADGYRLWFSEFGRYLVSGNGREISCETAGAPRAHQERFLFAQALPLAAVLHGFAVLHASAVAGDRGIVAFVGSSGAGKTTVASRLVLHGAGFVTDDVLALQTGSDVPLAHAGPSFMAIPQSDAGLLDPANRLGAAVGSSDKLHASPAATGMAMPLRAVFHIEHSEQFATEELSGLDAERLLATAFAPYLMTADRLHRHLEIVGQISSAVPQFVLRVPRVDNLEPIVRAIEARVKEFTS